MTLRTHSLKSQLVAWGVLSLLAAAAYAVAVRLLGGETSAWLFLARENVGAFAAVAFCFGWLAYEFRWDDAQHTAEPHEAYSPPAVPAADAPAAVRPPRAPEQPDHPSPQLSPGEEEWRKARRMPHFAVPTLDEDSEYLLLIKRSADLGFAPAMAKLGSYALRRNASVEAYYWFWCARKRGMRNLDRLLRGIRLQWAVEGYHAELAKSTALFDRRQHSIALALLDRDCGRNNREAAALLASVGF